MMRMLLNMPFFTGELEGPSSVLEYEKLLVGMIPSDERILLLERKRSPNFEGTFQQLEFNGNKYFEGEHRVTEWGTFASFHFDRK